MQKTRGAVKQNPNCAFHKHYSAVRAVVAVYIITPPWPGGGKGAALEIWSRTTHTLLTVKLSKNLFFSSQRSFRFWRLLPMVYSHISIHTSENMRGFVSMNYCLLALAWHPSQDDATYLLDIYISRYISTRYLHCLHCWWGVHFRSGQCQWPVSRSAAVGI